MPAHTVHVRRIYEQARPDEGTRVLVDRLWPRGMTKQRAGVDAWLREVAPSGDLRTWVHADMDGRWQEFTRRYRAELEENPSALDELRALHERGPLTLLYASRDETRNHALLLKAILES